MGDAVNVMSSGSVRDLLASLGSSQLPELGRIHLIGVEAIRERNPTRWSFRRDQVREFVERQFRRDFQSEDHFIPLDDVHYLIAQPSSDRLAAQARALRLLKDVLEFFLGTAALEDVRLSAVTGLGPEEVLHERLIVSQAEFDGAFKVLPAGADTVHPAPEAGRAEPGLRSAPRAKYEVMFLTEPVWCIQRRSVVSYRVRPLVFELKPEGVTPSDLRRANVKELINLDLAALSAAQTLLQNERTGAPFALHVPLHLASLCHADGRQSIVTALRRLQDRQLGPVIVCLSGLEPGTPASRMVETCRGLNRMCRGVVALAPDLSAYVQRWSEAQLVAIALDLDGATEPGTSPGPLQDFVRRAQSSTRSLIAYSVSDRATLMRAWSLGFTHISGEVIQRSLGNELRATLLRPIDIYKPAKASPVSQVA